MWFSRLWFCDEIRLIYFCECIRLTSIVLVRSWERSRERRGGLEGGFLNEELLKRYSTPLLLNRKLTLFLANIYYWSIIDWRDILLYTWCSFVIFSLYKNRKLTLFFATHWAYSSLSVSYWLTTAFLSSMRTDNSWRQRRASSLQVYYSSSW